MHKKYNPTKNMDLLKDIPKYKHYGKKRYPIPEKQRLLMYLDKQILIKKQRE